MNPFLLSQSLRLQIIDQRYMRWESIREFLDHISQNSVTENCVLPIRLENINFSGIFVPASFEQ